MIEFYSRKPGKCFIKGFEFFRSGRFGMKGKIIAEMDVKE